MPNVNFGPVMLALQLELIKTTGNYKSVYTKVKKKHNFFSKDTYYLTCEASEKNIIDYLLANNSRSKRILAIDKNELTNLLTDNNYDMKHNQFKTAANAKNIADYINTTIISCILKT